MPISKDSRISREAPKNNLRFLTPRADRGRVPIYVIGGFLGSGKTTLLQRLVRHAIASGAKPAVVMNEFSERNVDGELLCDHQDDERAFDLRSIVNGCVCCDLSKELTDEVRTVLHSTAGPVFIETSGLASVRQTADAVASALGEGPRPGRLASVIAVVDARRFPDLRRMGGDPAGDIRAADTVVLNKLDGVTPEAIASIETSVRCLNPTARIFKTTFADVPLTELMTATRPDIQPPSGATRGLAASPSTGGFVSVDAELLGPVSVDRLARVFQKYGRRIARVKGFLRTTDSWAVQELHWVPGALDVRTRRKATRIPPHLVIIGRRIDWDRFVVDLDDCVQMPA